MSLGISKFRRLILLSCLVASSAVVTHAQAQSAQRPRRFIELSETNTAEILTNLNQLTMKKEGIRELDDQLDSFKAFLGRRSFEQRFSAPYIRPTTPALPNKTIKELLERKQNWALTPEEMGTGLSSFDADATSIFSGEKPDAKQSSLQQFYDALSKKGGPGHQSFDQFSGDKKSSGSGSGSNSRESELSSTDDPNLPPALRDKAQKLRQLVTEDPSGIFNSSRPRSSFDNFFGLADNNNSTASGAHPKGSMDSPLQQFIKAIDGPAGANRLDPGLQSLLPTGDTPKPAVLQSRDPLASTIRHGTPDSTPGNINAVVERNTSPDITSAVVNQWNPLYAPPKIELPKYTPPTPVNLEFPRRKF